jgi:hypothetical protein
MTEGTITVLTEDRLRAIIREELLRKTEIEDAAQHLSGKVVITMFHPNITLQTLHNYVQQGIIRKYKIGKRSVYYKKAEVLEAVQKIKPYSHNKTLPR